MVNQRIALKQLNELKKLGHSLRLAAEWRKPWQSLISTMLSARTRDEVTIEVCNKLFRKYDSPRALAKASLKNIQRMIRPVNFYINKSKSLSRCAKMLVSEYKSKVPNNFDKLIQLPGVGRKTANVFLATQGKSAIGVDTHISYISQRLCWTRHNKPKDIEKDLEKLFPKRMWRNINYIVVRFGRTYKSKSKKDDLLNKIKKIR